MMPDGYLLNLRAFREVGDDKAQALKPLEEAAEAFGAWQQHDDMRFSPTMTSRRSSLPRWLELRRPSSAVCFAFSETCASATCSLLPTQCEWARVTSSRRWTNDYR